MAESRYSLVVAGILTAETAVLGAEADARRFRRERDELRCGNAPCVDDDGTPFAGARTWRAAHAEVTRERDEARETNHGLHRRVQEAEANADRKADEWQARCDTCEQRMARAKAWIDEHALVADWVSPSDSPFWTMTSQDNRAALAELIHQRDGALALLRRWLDYDGTNDAFGALLTDTRAALGIGRGKP